MADGPRFSAVVQDACSQLGMSASDLWVAYFSVGGNGSLADLERWVTGEADPDDRDHDLVAQALNEEFLARDLDHPIGYRADILRSG